MVQEVLSLLIYVWKAHKEELAGYQQGDLSSKTALCSLVQNNLFKE